MNKPQDQLEPLGATLYQASFSIEGKFTALEIEGQLLRIIDLIGMDNGGLPPGKWEYPMATGQGGAGATVAVPMVLAPLVESFELGFSPLGFVVSDVWTDFNHTFFNISSCRWFDFRALGNFIHGHIGRIYDSYFRPLRTPLSYARLDAVIHLPIGQVKNSHQVLLAGGGCSI